MECSRFQAGLEKNCEGNQGDLSGDCPRNSEEGSIGVDGEISTADTPKGNQVEFANINQTGGVAPAGRL